MFIWIPTWLFAIMIITLIFYVYGTWNHSHFIHLKIPFLKPIPMFGNMAMVAFRRRAIGDHLKHIYDTFQDCKIIGMFEFNNPILFVRDPEIIKVITVKDFEYFTDHRSPITAEADPLFGRNLFSLRGDRWKEMRHTLSPAFTSSKMKAMFLLVDKCGEQMGEHLEKQCKASKDGLLELEMKDFFTKYTNDVIATSAFGIQCDSLEQPDNEFYRMGKDASTFGGIRTIIFMLYGVCPKIMQALGITLFSTSEIKFYRSLVQGTIAAREKAGIIRPDMIHLLMQARKGTLRGDMSEEIATDAYRKKKTEWTDDDVTAQALLFFVAGFDTTSTLLCFLSHLLATHPDIQTRVQDEIDAVLEEEGGKLTYEGVQKLKYLDMVISETLRLWPPAMAAERKCVRPYILPATDTTPSVKMAAGDGIWIPTFALHRDPKYFPDPDHFDPGRFSEENKHNINPFAYVPFGVGPRSCIGMRFAQMEAKIAVVNLFSRFDLQVIDRTQKTLQLDKERINTHVEGGFWLGIKLRTSSSTTEKKCK